jgi:hypothetical protein
MPGVQINVRGNTANLNLDDAKKKITGLKEHTISESKAAALGMKVIAEGHLNNARAAEVFLVETLKLGPAMKAAFSLVGPIALGAMLTEVGSKVYEFFTNLRDSAEKNAGAWRELNSGLALTNVELELTNAKLEQEINKLEGKHQNGLQIALAEARVEAAKLGQALDKDIDSIYKLMKEHAPGWLDKLFGQIDDPELREYIGGKTGMGGKRKTIDDIVDYLPARIDQEVSIGNITKQKPEDSAQKAIKRALKAIDDEVIKVNNRFSDAITDAYKKLGEHEELRPIPRYRGQVGPQQYGMQTIPGDPNQQERIETLEAAQRAFEQTAAHAKDIVKNADLNIKKGDDELGRNALEEAKKAAEKQLQGWEEGFKLYEGLQARSLEDDKRFWTLKLSYIKDIGGAGADEARKINEKIFGYDSEIRKRDAQTAASDYQQNQESIYKDLMDRVQAAKTANTYPGGRPEAAALTVLQAGAPGLTDDSKLQQIREEILKAILGVQKEITEEQKKQLELSQKLADIQVKSKEQSDFGKNVANRQALEIVYASQRVHSYQDELTYIRQIGASEVEQLQTKLKALQTEVALDYLAGNYVKMGEDALKVDKAILDIDEKRRQTVIQIAQAQAQQNESLKDGWDEFINKATNDAAKPGKILEEGLDSAIDETSDNLMKAMTGQKTAWAKEFKSIGENMLKQSIKLEIEKGLSLLFPKKPTTQDQAMQNVMRLYKEPLPVVVTNPSQSGQTGPTATPGSGGGGGAAGGGANWSKPVSWLANAFGGILGNMGGGSGGGGAAAGAGESVTSTFTPMAADAPIMDSGGDVSPGKNYLIGLNRKPEVFSSAVSGHITPMDQIGGGDHVVNYNINAPNAELGAYHRIERSIMAAHNAAVVNSQHTAAQERIRTPQHRGK